MAADAPPVSGSSSAISISFAGAVSQHTQLCCGPSSTCPETLRVAADAVRSSADAPASNELTRAPHAVMSTAASRCRNRRCRFIRLRGTPANGSHPEPPGASLCAASRLSGTRAGAVERSRIAETSPGSEVSPMDVRVPANTVTVKTGGMFDSRIPVRPTRHSTDSDRRKKLIQNGICPIVSQRTERSRVEDRTSHAMSKKVFSRRLSASAREIHYRRMLLICPGRRASRG